MVLCVVDYISFTHSKQTSCFILGGYNVRQLDPIWFRRHMGLVSQEPVLFASTIAENISYGRDSATQSEVYTFILLFGL